MVKCRDCRYNSPNFFVCTYDTSQITLADVFFNSDGQIIGCEKGIAKEKVNHK